MNVKTSLTHQFALFYVMSGLRVRETNEKELVMEPAIRWAGNPNIVLVLKLLSLRITVQVRKAVKSNQLQNYESFFYYVSLCIIS